MALTKLILAFGCAASTAIAFSGDLTYYTPGLGACGKPNTEADRVVALPEGQYCKISNPNDCYKCGDFINIHYNGKSTTAQIKDKCWGCEGDSIDVSPTVFKELEALEAGRIQVTWEYA
ncbi:putative plant expansin protein [Eutypa lata UCREL1]|uniref:Putative plant expansin protein n=1 Tax=Eutypa lata (strain UCR-EL1) TaxID=1287681 RepID=M7SQY3_EUTLA|nr:putative plant expansin protein [Eutypa lata UCREL1]